MKIQLKRFCFMFVLISLAFASCTRGLNTASAIGYQQYPYFGGDEAAPHKMTIKIKNL